MGDAASPRPEGPVEARLARWVEAWLRDSDFDRGLSANTKAAYRLDLRHFIGFLRRRGLSDPAEAGTADLVDFLAARGQAGDARTTRTRRAAAIRSFFRWAVETGRLTRDPSLLLPAPRPDRLIPRALDRDSTARIFAGAGRDSDPESLRERLVFEILYGSGLRAGEAAGLRLRDIDRETGLVRVLGKGSKERKVPFGAALAAALDAYLRRSRPRFVRPLSGDTLLLGARGGPLGRDGIYRIVKRRVRLLGLDPDASPHTFRHTFATDLVKNGADLRAVQEMLGHASIDTTQRYTMLADDHLRQAHRRHHPRA